MSTLRFEGQTLDDAVQAASEAVGPKPRVVGATKVRRGGVAGFFAREHVEVEVEVDTAGSRPALPTAGPGPAVAPATGTRGPQAVGPVAPVAALAAVAGATPVRAATTGPRPTTLADLLAREDALNAEASARDDALANLLTEMAANGPSSVLDLAEELNAGPSGLRFSRPFADQEPAGPATTSLPPTRPVPAVPAGAAPRRKGSNTAPPPNFADVLEQIARRSGLVADGAGELAPGEIVGISAADEQAAHHAEAILADLDDEPAPAPAGASTPGARPAQRPVLDLAADPPGTANHPGATAPVGTAGPPAATLPATTGPVGAGLPAARDRLAPVAVALHQLGLPAPACEAVSGAATLQQLETELRRTLEHTLPAPAPLPRQATSVLAVVGPKSDVLGVARALAERVGAPPDAVTLATQRNVWRQKAAVITGPESAAEQRRGWRWRSHPAVVAIEAPVRPVGNEWAATVLQALEPVACWGVTDAARKPEDVDAWSEALGGLDALALVDLDGTTTPASVLNCRVPVGLVDGRPATPALWAGALCARLAR